jgi:SAM-dependent methyltransferase
MINDHFQSIDQNNFSSTKLLWLNETQLHQYNKYIVSKLTSNINRDNLVLDFGAGIGTLASIVKKNTGIKPDCIEIDGAQQLIIESRGFRAYKDINELERKYDLIYSSNVMEHIEDDLFEFGEINKALVMGGRLTLYLPARKELYSELDISIGHYRRYDKSELFFKLEKSGFRVMKSEYVDSLGYLIWLIYKLLKVKSFNLDSNKISLKTYVFQYIILPMSIIFDRLICSKYFGKNIFIEAVKISNLHD